MAFLLSDHSAFRGKVALVIATVIFGWGAALGSSPRPVTGYSSMIVATAAGDHRSRA